MKCGGEWKENRIVYPGTHDNSPIRGWFRGRKKISSSLRKRCLKKAGTTEFDNFFDNFIAWNMASDARWTILPMQDIMRLGEWSKMNSPSTIGSPNWEWKMVDFTTFSEERPFMSYLIDKYNR